MQTISCSQGKSPSSRSFTPSSHRFGLSNFKGLSLACVFLAGCGTPYRHEERITLSAPPPTGKLVVDNSVGSIRVNADASAKGVRAEISKIGKGYSEQVAREAMEEIEVRLEATDNGTTVLAAAEHPKSTSGRNYEVAWVITAPPHIDVDVRNDVGDVHLQGHTKSIGIKNNVGDATVTAGSPQSPIAGPVHIASNVGDVHVTGAKGGLTVVSDVGDVHATVGGNVDIRTDVGDVTLKLLPLNAETVKVSTDVGDICIYLGPEQQGKLIADCDTGSIRMNVDGPRVKELRERDHHASAQLGDAQQPMIDLTADVGSITVGSFTP